MEVKSLVIRARLYALRADYDHLTTSLLKKAFWPHIFVGGEI
jgi:hypothetical protein